MKIKNQYLVCCFSNGIFFLFFLVLFAVSCSSIKYELLKTPHELDIERKNAIISDLENEFSKQKINYQSIYFSKTTILKPASHYILDSLYALKYNLELKNKIDQKIEHKINEQKLIIQNDTTPIYFVLNHVFTTTQDGIYKTFNSKIILSKDNKIQTFEILNSYELPKNLVKYYAYYSFNESFMYPGSEVDEAELAFYDFYKDGINNLEEKEVNKFLITMFNVMKIANDTKNLDKTNLIEFMVLNYVTKTNVMFVTDKFNKIEEQVDSNLNMNYFVEFSYVDKTFGKVINVDVYLDQYLNLIEIVEKKQ